MDNKAFATHVIKKFNESGLLEVRGETYKKAHYPNENIALQNWLEHKRISFVHEERLNSSFYSRELYGRIRSAFDSAEEIYFMLKEAL